MFSSYWKREFQKNRIVSRRLRRVLKFLKLSQGFPGFLVNWVSFQRLGISENFSQKESILLDFSQMENITLLMFLSSYVDP